MARAVMVLWVECDGSPEEEIRILSGGTGKQRGDDPGAGSGGYMESCQAGKDMS